MKSGDKRTDGNDEGTLEMEAEMTDTQWIMESWHDFTYWWGTALMLFGVCVVMAGIFTEKNNPPWDHDQSHPALEFFLFWGMLSWIAMLEGCQISVVGLQGYDPEVFRESHPRAYAACKLVHTGPNVERFLVGRQFLLLFNGFLVSRIGGGQSIDHLEMGDWTWNHELTQFFYSNGTLLMVVIVALGQLPCQLVAAEKLLGFFNLPLGHIYTVLYPCLFVESLGLTHSSYLLKDVLCWISGIDQSKADPEKELNKNFAHWAKCLLSVTAVFFSGTMVIKGIAYSQTNATDGAGWRKLPGGLAVVVSLFFIFMLASAEGIQVSVIALATVNGDTYKKKAPLAYRTAELALRGRNMSAFLVGRQFLTAMNMVLLARVTSYAGSDGNLKGGHDWGFGSWFNNYGLQWGFMGAILVVNVAQLASQVTASIFPIAVINNYFMNWILKLMLFVEFSGIVNAAWPLAYLVTRFFDMEDDPEDKLIFKPGYGPQSMGLGDEDGEFGIPEQTVTGDQVVVLDVGGTMYKTSLSTLQSVPGSTLAEMFNDNSMQRSKDGSYFIDRDGTSFQYVLNFLRCRKMVLPRDEVARELAIIEAEYYGISETAGIVPVPEEKTQGNEDVL